MCSQPSTHTFLSFVQLFEIIIDQETAPCYSCVLQTLQFTVVTFLAVEREEKEVRKKERKEERKKTEREKKRHVNEGDRIKGERPSERNKNRLCKK
jgi:hypothetical protein